MPVKAPDASPQTHRQHTPTKSTVGFDRDRAGANATAFTQGRVADVTSSGQPATMLDRPTSSQASGPQNPLLQLQRKYGNRYVQRLVSVSRNGDGEGSLDPGLEQAINRARSGGQALDSRSRSQMEPAFGADFSGVRIHTGSEADGLNRELNARAFTTGQDIFFRRGEFNSGSAAGQEILAHELTHVVQQSGGRVHAKLTVSQPGDPSERQADRMAKAVVNRQRESGQMEQAHQQVGRQAEEEEDRDPLQMKSADSQLQRQPEEEEDREPLQMKSADSQLQRQPEEDEDIGLFRMKADGSRALRQKHNGRTEGTLAHVVQRSGGQVQAKLTIGQPGDALEREADDIAKSVLQRVQRQVKAGASEEAEAEAENKAREGGPGPDSSRRDNPVPVENEAEMGSFEIAQIRSQEGEQINRMADTTGFIDLWPSNLYVAMRTPPDIIKSTYNQGYSPQVYFNHEFSWDTHSGPSGHYYINGTVHDSWDNESDWTPLKTIPTTSLNWPQANGYDAAGNTVEATFITRPDFHWDNRTVRAKSHIETYDTALVAAPTEEITDFSYNKSGYHFMGPGVGSGQKSGGGPITVTGSQSVTRQTSSTASGSFGNTTSFGSETDATASGGIQEKDKWNLGVELGGKWSRGEEQSASRTLSESSLLVTQESTTITRTYEVPEGVPCVILLVPVEKHVTNSFKIRDSDGSGLITEETSGATIDQVSEFAVPAGWTAVYGYDDQYATALQTHYEEMRTLRQECNGLKGDALEAKKLEMREKIANFRREVRPSQERARRDAWTQLESLNAAPGPVKVDSPRVSPVNIKHWQDYISEFQTFANSTT